MYTRISSGILALSLATACSSEPDNAILAEAEDRAAATASDDGRIECAVNGETNFSKGCLTERLSSDTGTTLIIRHPDGGFRRFNVLTDGRGLEAADGAEKAKIEIVEAGKIRISVGADKYIMPVTVKSKETQNESADTPQQSADLQETDGEQSSD